MAATAMPITNAEAVARYRKRHPERIKANRKRHWLRELARRRLRRRDPKTWALVAIHQIKARAKSKGIPFSITAADIPLPEKCPVLGLKLTPGTKATKYDFGTLPSVDRIIPALGYVPGNVVVISYRANRLKCDATASELRQVANWMESVSRQQ